VGGLTQVAAFWSKKPMDSGFGFSLFQFVYYRFLFPDQYTKLKFLPAIRAYLVISITIAFELMAKLCITNHFLVKIGQKPPSAGRFTHILGQNQRF
jgi:hypothetical protein